MHLRDDEKRKTDFSRKRKIIYQQKIKGSSFLYVRLEKGINDLIIKVILDSELFVHWKKNLYALIVEIC